MSARQFLLALGVVFLSACGQPVSQLRPQATAALPPTPVPSPSLPSSSPTPPPPTLLPPTTTPPVPTATTAPTEIVGVEIHDTASLNHSAAPPTPEPTPASEQAPASAPERLVIDSIGLDGVSIPVGLDERLIPIVPQHEIGWYNLSAMPGQGENVVFWGHVLRFQSAPDIPAPFARLREAQLGDQVRLYTSDGSEHVYQITQQVWVTPDQVEYILPQGRELLTIVSCIGDAVIADGSVIDMTHRLITIAEPLA
jgi:LPXTG-site transpeptidase (sortase) family protein